MRRANVGEAKAHFSALVKRAELGEEVIVTRSGIPVARIVSASDARERSFANDEGLGFVAEDFDAPLPPQLIEQFYG